MNIEIYGMRIRIDVDTVTLSPLPLPLMKEYGVPYWVFVSDWLDDQRTGTACVDLVSNTPFQCGGYAALKCRQGDPLPVWGLSSLTKLKGGE